MPFDFIDTTRLEKLLKTRAILDTQTDEAQATFRTCLWHGMHKASLIDARKDKTAEVMGALGINRSDAEFLISGAPTMCKRDILDRLIGDENAKRGVLDRVRGALGQLVLH
jgi:hypothetical protein